MIIDMHCHWSLTHRPADAAIERFSFEPAVDPDDPNDIVFDSCASPRAGRWWSWKFLQRMMGIDRTMRVGDPRTDARIEEFFFRHLLAAGPVERCVLLAFDWYRDNRGNRPPLPGGDREFGNDIYTSNSYVRHLCRTHPQRFLFGASVHPYRPAALRCIEEVFHAGAALLKWLPLHQNIDALDPRTLDALRLCADLGLPVLAHYGEEFTLGTNHPELVPVHGFLEALRRLRREGAMPPAIVAHVATPVWPLGHTASYEATCTALLDEFADAPLYADISAITTPGKTHFAKKLARQQDLHHKLIFGSDFPIPPGPFLLRWQLGREYASITQEPSWPQQALKACRGLGFNEIVFQRAEEVLPHVNFFADRQHRGNRPAVE